MIISKFNLNSCMKTINLILSDVLATNWRTVKSKQKNREQGMNKLS